MNKVEFNYFGSSYTVQCGNDVKMKDIINRILGKMKKNRNDVFFLYNGRMINNEELSFIQCAGKLDRDRNQMNILILDGQDSDNQNLIKSKHIICPICKDNAFISIEDFKLTIYGCKAGHKTANLQINEFMEKQIIDQSEIKCKNCNNAKSDIPDYQFFKCNTCHINLCPTCKISHDNSHTKIDYEETVFKCDLHNEIFKYYCTDCKMDLCSSCENGHKNHKFITYDSIIPCIDKKELKYINEKLSNLKAIIDGMKLQLEKLNKNLDIYYEIYNNVISNFDIKKGNYSIIQNLNTINKFNTNFIGNVTEIIKDSNMKSQFTNIINLQAKLEFKKVKKNNNNIEENQNTTQNEQTIAQNDNNNDIIQNYNPLNDKYENFNISKTKELQSFTTKNNIENLLVLNDRRILSSQSYSDENGYFFYKLCVYSAKNGFVCDINIDSEYISDLIILDDGNVLLRNENQIKIVKIKKNSIEEIFKLEQKLTDIKKLLNSKFLFYTKLSSKNKNSNNNNFLSAIIKKYKKVYEIYSYKDGQLICEKNITELYNDENIKNSCQINENEFALYSYTKGKIYGHNDILIFYDMKTDKKIKELKVGNGDNYDYMILFNKDLLLIAGKDDTAILINVHTRNIVNKIPFIYWGSEYLLLNEKILLIQDGRKIVQYEFENISTIKLKEKNENNFGGNIILKYPENRLITYDDNKIIIFGY